MVGTLSTFNADIMDAMQLDTDMVVDYPDLVFCNDCMAFIRHALKDVIVDSKSLAFDLIKEVGPGGNFLTSQHTFSNFKTELWHSDLFDHDNWDAWEAKGSKTIRDSALEKVRSMLEKKPVSILSSDQELAIDTIVEKAAKELSGK